MTNLNKISINRKLAGHIDMAMLKDLAQGKKLSEQVSPKAQVVVHSAHINYVAVDVKYSVSLTTKTLDEAKISYCCIAISTLIHFIKSRGVYHNALDEEGNEITQKLIPEHPHKYLLSSCAEVVSAFISAIVDNNLTYDSPKGAKSTDSQLSHLLDAFEIRMNLFINNLFDN